MSKMLELQCMLPLRLNDIELYKYSRRSAKKLIISSVLLI